MDRKEFIEIATHAAKVYGELHYLEVIDAGDTIQAISDCIVAALNDGYDEITQPLNNYSTEELYEELRKRSEVNEFNIVGGISFDIADGTNRSYTFDGPVGVLVVKREEQAK